MHLSPVKGGFPHKDQHDRTAPVKLEDTKLVQRGNVIMIDADSGEFRLAQSGDTGPFFLALQRFDDLQAAMAGQFSPASGTKVPYPSNPVPATRAVRQYNTAPLQGGIRPSISGIHMDDGDVWEDDMFNEAVDWEGAKFNAPLTVADNGLITLAKDGDNVIGFLVKAPYQRYCNDAVAVDSMMTGATRWVIQFQCGK